MNAHVSDNRQDAFVCNYADFKLVKTRKVAQIILEIPLENAASFIRAFGIPDPSAEVPVALALLDGKAVKTTREKKKFSELKPSAQAVLLCKKEAFWKFLTEMPGHAGRVRNEESAASMVRFLCRVTSRAELNANAEATADWEQLRGQFDAWMGAA